MVPALADQLKVKGSLSGSNAWQEIDDGWLVSMVAGEARTEEMAGGWLIGGKIGIGKVVTCFSRDALSPSLFQATTT